MIFYSSYYVFQEQGMRKMIGHAREREREMNGLYYLELSFSQNKTKNHVPVSFLSKISSTIRDNIWLHHHHHLGHPSFGVLKIMFPLLFKGMDVEKLHYDVCELVKHCCASFPTNSQRVSFPFHNS